MTITDFLFFAFAGVVIASALGVVASKNPVHSALFLVLTFFSSSAIWLMLEAEFLAITLVLGGCATHSPQTESQPAETASEEPAWAVEPWDGYGLEIPLDGTSMEAWERSLVSVKAYSEPADYKRLLGAIDYLLLYDVGARGQMDLLIKRLNGLTGYQILSRVGWRNPGRTKAPEKKSPDGGKPQDSD